MDPTIFDNMAFGAFAPQLPPANTMSAVQGGINGSNPSVLNSILGGFKPQPGMPTSMGANAPMNILPPVAQTAPTPTGAINGAAPAATGSPNALGLASMGMNMMNKNKPPPAPTWMNLKTPAPMGMLSGRF